MTLRVPTMGWLVGGSQLQVAKTRSGRHDSVPSRTQEALKSVSIARKARRPTFVTPKKPSKNEVAFACVQWKKGNAALEHRFQRRTSSERPRIYRAVKSGKMDDAKAQRLVWMLGRCAPCSKRKRGAFAPGARMPNCRRGQAYCKT